MAYEWYLLIGVSGICVATVGWGCRNYIRDSFRPSYSQLLEQKNRLHDSVIDWRYPDGSHIPQHKRQRMFRQLSKLSHQIRHHPDNPERRQNAKSQ